MGERSAAGERVRARVIECFCRVHGPTIIVSPSFLSLFLPWSSAPSARDHHPLSSRRFFSPPRSSLACLSRPGLRGGVRAGAAPTRGSLFPDYPRFRCARGRLLSSSPTNTKATARHCTHTRVAAISLVARREEADRQIDTDGSVGGHRRAGISGDDRRARPRRPT